MRRRAFVIVAVLAALTAALVATSISTAAPSGTKVADLFAGKTTDVGDVFVWNNATNLYVEIALAGGWCMTESHVAAADDQNGIPQNSQQNPTPGQFAYGDTYSPCESGGDTFPIPLAGLGTSPFAIAVHAKVWEESVTSSLNVFSDGGNTQVTASTAGGALPRTAVDVWEAFGDPADPTPSVWDNGVGVGTFQFADWIWSDYRVNTPAVDERATFQRNFTVPGPVAPGSWMKVTTDDAFTASLNGTPVASGAWPTWPTVKTAGPFAPLAGANTLVFVATNTDDSYGPLGTPDNNPGGLIYEARVPYYTHSESAWAGTPVGAIQFNSSKSWATYINYSVIHGVMSNQNNYGAEFSAFGSTGHLKFYAVAGTSGTLGDLDWKFGDPNSPTIAFSGVITSAVRSAGAWALVTDITQVTATGGTTISDACTITFSVQDGTPDQVGGWVWLSEPSTCAYGTATGPYPLTDGFIDDF